MCHPIGRAFQIADQELEKGGEPQESISDILNHKEEYYASLSRETAVDEASDFGRLLKDGRGSECWEIHDINIQLHFRFDSNC